MTPQQLATIKANILASPDLNSQPNNSDGAFGTGSDAVPATLVFEGEVSVQDIIEARNS